MRNLFIHKEKNIHRDGNFPENPPISPVAKKSPRFPTNIGISQRIKKEYPGHWISERNFSDTKENKRQSKIFTELFRLVEKKDFSISECDNSNIHDYMMPPDFLHTLENKGLKVSIEAIQISGNLLDTLLPELFRQEKIPFAFFEHGYHDYDVWMIFFQEKEKIRIIDPYMHWDNDSLDNLGIRFSGGAWSIFSVSPFDNNANNDSLCRHSSLDHMLSQDFLTKFLPAYDYGDMAILHELRRKMFEETMQIVKNRTYTTEDGQFVTLPEPSAMMNGSQLYRSVEPINLPEQSNPTIVEVKDSDSLLAGKQLLEEGYRPAVLNFANRQTAGGGVLNGCGAQEENMFRRSNLFLSLYQFHPNGMDFEVPQRQERYPMERTTGGAYTPNITVFRGLETEGYPLLRTPYHLGIVTVAAMNRPELKNQYQIAEHLVEPVKEKMRTIFRIALRHGHDAIVLGAWGCGAFKNPPQHIAKLFHQVMEENEFRNRFKKIVFAIVDRRKLEIGPQKIGNFLPFQEEFSSVDH